MIQVLKLLPNITVATVSVDLQEMWTWLAHHLGHCIHSFVWGAVEPRDIILEFIFLEKEAGGGYQKRQRADEDEDVVAENKEGRAPPRGRPRTTTTNGRSAKRRKETSAAASTLSHPTSQVASTSAPSSTAAITSAGTRRGATRSGAGRRTENPYPVIPSVHPTALPIATGLLVSSQLIEPGTEMSSAPNWAPPPVAPASIVGPSINTQQARENPYPSLRLENPPVVAGADTTSSSAVGVHSQASSSGIFLDLQVSQSFDLPPTQKQARNTYPTPPTTISTPMASTYPNPFDPVDLSGVPQENLVVFGQQAAKFLATYPGMRTQSVFASADDMLQPHNRVPQVEPPQHPVLPAAPRNEVRRNASGTAPDAYLQKHH
ncbi:hypothetical protein ONZ45_g6151 [Pleurotus djamor]|nr:hypothetical protein ONZ45_g6151 [Pleurotus djamor]